MKAMIHYEWTAETLDEFEDITDNDFAESYEEIARRAIAKINSGAALIRVGLVRNQGTEADGVQDREWAYIDDAGKLPDHFETAGGGKGAKVPKKFHREIERTQK